MGPEYQVISKDKYLLEKIKIYFRSVTSSDSGQYECQVSTEQKISKIINLNVVGEFFILPSDKSVK